MADKQQTALDEQAWRGAYQAGMRPGDGSCPGHKELAALVVAEIDAESRAALADHIAGCRECAEDYRVLSELHREAGGPAAGSRTLRWKAAGLAAALIAGVGVAVWWSQSANVATTRGDAVRGGVRLIEVEPAPESVLAVPPRYLRWQEQPAATGYVVHLYDAAANPLEGGVRTDAAQLELPTRLRRQLEPDMAYFWVVEVEGLAAQQRLGPYWFELQLQE